MIERYEKNDIYSGRDAARYGADLCSKSRYADGV